MNRENRSRSRGRLSLGWWAQLVLAGVGLTLPSCTSFSLFGYTTQGNYDTHYRTVKVTMAQNRTYYQRWEFMLTQALVDQIEQRSPYKVVSNDSADLELMSRIITITKNVQLEGPVNEQRVDAMVMVVEVLLKDLHTGQILSRPPKRPSNVLTGEEVPMIQDIPPDIQTGIVSIPVPVPQTTPGAVDQSAVMNNDPNAPPPGPQLPPPVVPPQPGVGPRPLGGIIVRGTDTFIPELGQTITSSEQRLCINTAVQIVQMMEKPW